MIFMRRYYSYNTVKEEGRKKKKGKREREKEGQMQPDLHILCSILIVPALVGLQISRSNSLTARFVKIISL